ncbi:MauE/DoxX family redox-associated membrane protein [Sphingobacterium corticibacterium]|uniref:MauE/DoxX family redox-associated membrane protein n=1 Tax=Sphingobacterium corticibacterium TaxID=2484746 RepID=UPI0019D14F80|nr:MauE/DoxX family redox-associated membrane protein [Sphingobacterium corticibacterium]
MKKQKIILRIITGLLLAMWIPATMDKLVHFGEFSNGMLKQPFPDSLGRALVYLLPAMEILTVLLLVIQQFARSGFLLSAALMAVFSNYVGMTLLLGQHDLPCICGSLIPKLGWFWHFWFNLLFLALSILGYYVERNYRRSVGSVEPASRAGRPKDNILKSFFNSLNLKQ